MMPMKNLLKGLRYISQVFESEKEEEIQIGAPTDIKHVAHIGMDGPSANTPSWMNRYGADSEPPSPNSESKQKASTKSPARESSESPIQRKTNKPARRNHSSSSSLHSDEGESFNSSRPRRNKHSEEMGPDSQSDNAPRIPKGRRKKSNESSNHGPKSKGSDQSDQSSPSPDPSPDPGLKDIQVATKKPVNGEGSEGEVISRRDQALQCLEF